MHYLRSKVHAVSDATDFIESVRLANWSTAIELVRNGAVGASLATPGNSVAQWLVELDAPTSLVVEIIRVIAESGKADPNKLGVLFACLELIPTHANAAATFRTLLEEGLSPNVIVSGGATLLQKAFELNRVHQVDALLRYGADPRQKNVFGLDSTTNLEEASYAGNASGQLAIQYWKEAGLV